MRNYVNQPCYENLPRTFCVVTRKLTGLNGTNPGWVDVAGRPWGESNSVSEFTSLLTSVNHESSSSCDPSKGQKKKKKKRGKEDNLGKFHFACSQCMKSTAAKSTKSMGSNPVLGHYFAIVPIVITTVTTNQTTIQICTVGQKIKLLNYNQTYLERLKHLGSYQREFSHPDLIPA